MQNIIIVPPWAAENVGIFKNSKSRPTFLIWLVIELGLFICLFVYVYQSVSLGPVFIDCFVCGWVFFIV